MTTLAPESPAWLADLYRPEDMEAWHLLARHFELTEGFSFVLFLAPDDWALQYLRSQLPQLLGSDDAVRRVRFDPTAGEEALAEAVLSLPPLPPTVRCVWIDADPASPEMFAARDKAWSAALSRLNRYRNTLQSRFTCTLVLAVPISLEPILRSAAPDLYSIRSAVLRAEPRRPVPREWLSPFEPRRSNENAETKERGDPDATLAEAAKLRGKPGREMLLAELLLRAGRQALSRRQWGLSVQSLEEAYELEKQHGGFPDLRFRITLSLAAVFFELARYDRARFHAEQALEIARSHFGEDDPRTATALSTLGSLLLVTNDVSRAEPLMRKALAVDEARLGADHADVATDLNNLAGLLKATNRLAEAERLVRRALVIDEVSLGSHPKVAADLNNLAQLLKATSRLEEAEPLMRRALAIDQESFGPDHPEVATDLNNLARLLQARNHLLEAEPLMQRALAIDEKSFRPDHPRVATDLNNLALLLNATDRPAEAEQLMRRAWAIDQAAFGPAHPNVAIRLNNLAELLQDTSRLAEAEPLMRRAVLILMQSLDRTGHPHPDLAAAIGNYSAMLQDMGRSAAQVAVSLDELRREAKADPGSAEAAPIGV